ncbi:hypothetical protein NLJ89_g11195 [Agrocybe chaxingu]|uniref:Carboxylesterase type B domain-containing protein n=1 Tax=Agrocybe chaxingu TaxID=84603 RepID=A0A9W8JQF3_9AGAR|nr:hypothetical protein NLJ89_g11195 [Agrocybe chaxingu]
MVSKGLVLQAIFALLITPQSSSTTLVKLSYGSFEGKTSENLVEFLGIPFASPPVGPLRFAAPVKPKAFHGTRQATSFAPACPQQAVMPLPQFPPISVPPANISEDCLYLNVIKPAKIVPGKKLPVLFYIFGGAFEIGDTTQVHGDSLVNRSLDLGEPIIYVTASYRVNAFGFLGGKEVQAAGLGNVGLLDQRFALEWVQKHIGAFGGDPKKVTMQNEGNTQGLFRAGAMQSGSPIRLPGILRQQKYFDSLVADTNCTASTDRLKCLRDAPFDQLMAAVNRTPTFLSYESLNLAWQPMVDGKVIVRDPLVSLQQGTYAKTLQHRTNAEYLEYMKSNYFPNLADEDLPTLESAYPDDVTQGSPFNTGTANALTPQYKRLAAVQGDLEFQAPRRFFSRIASKTQPVYGFRYTRTTQPALLGVRHGADRDEFVGEGASPEFIGTDALIYLTCNGDPNPPEGSKSLLQNVKWEPYSSSLDQPPLLTFVDGESRVNITFDTHRSEAMELLTRLSLNEIGKPF